MKCLALALLPFLAAPRTNAQDAEKLGDLARRLDAGDRAAIEELLAITRPPSAGLTDANERIARLRADVERLKARQLARPVFAPEGTSDVERGDAAPAPGRVDALRESRAWLRAGEPELALRALPAAEGITNDDDALYVEARALEKLGRGAEALEAYRRVANTAASALLRTRAADDVAHLEWRARVAAARKETP